MSDIHSPLHKLSQRVLLPIRTLATSQYRWLVYGAVCLLVVWVSWRVAVALFGLEAPEYKTVKVEEGALVATISASGTLSPVHSITVGTQVTGMIKEIDVDFNSIVKKGQVIARIDPREYQAKYDQAEANYLLAKKNHDFNLKLVAKGFISPQAVAQTEGTYKATLGALNLAKKSLDDTVIRSHVYGVVVKRSVEVGQTVAASLQAPELFIIAKDLTDMQVETSIDESDVGRLKEGMEATFTVDAFPGKVFQEKVTQIRKAPVTIQNVVTYTVLISANNPEFKLLPGMTANVKVVVDKRDNVLKIPNAALRFRMPTSGSQEKSGPPGMGASPMGGIGGLGASRSANTGQRQTSSPWGGLRKVWVLENSYRDWETDRKSTRLNSSHSRASRMPSSA